MVELHHSQGYKINFRSLCNSVKKGDLYTVPEPIYSEIRSAKNPAIAEIAGCDSVSAVIKAVESHGFDSIIPVVVHTGTEYGIQEALANNIELIRAKTKVRVFDPVILEDLEFWRVLNGRFIQMIFKEYGFYSPCVGCHLYLHAMRIPLALALSIKHIISGERESHDGKIKINQMPSALDSYTKMMAKWGIDLILPLRHVTDSKEILNISDNMCKPEKQHVCMFRGNYRDVKGNVLVNPLAIDSFYTGFGLPITVKIMEKLLEDSNANIEDVVKDHLK